MKEDRKKEIMPVRRGRLRLHFVFCKKRRRGLAYRRRIQREDEQINEKVRR
jgi:hypothetical protein